MTLVGGDAGGGFAQRLRQAVEVALLQHQPPGLLVLQDVLRELRRQRRQPLVDLGDARLLLGAQLGAGPHQPLVAQLQHAPLLVGEVEFVAPLVEIGDALEDPPVEHHRRLVRGELRRHLALDRLQRLVGVRAGEIVEDGGDLFDQPGALLQRHDGVVERRLGGLTRDGGDLRLVLLQRRRERRLEVLRLDLLERRQAEGGAPARQQRIFRLRACRCGRAGLGDACRDLAAAGALGLGFPGFALHVDAPCKRVAARITCSAVMQR